MLDSRPLRAATYLHSLPPTKRQAIAGRLVEILPAMRGLDEPGASQAIEDLERRLGRGLQVPPGVLRQPHRGASCSWPCWPATGAASTASRR